MKVRTKGKAGQQDAQWIGELRSGAEREFHPVVVRFQDGIYSFFQRLIDDEEVARTLSEELLVGLYRSRERLRDQGGFAAALYRSAADFLERYYESSFARQRLSIWREQGAAAPAGGEHSPRADELVVRRYQRILSALAPRLRRAYVLCALERLSSAQTSEALGVSEGEVLAVVDEARCFVSDYLFPSDGAAAGGKKDIGARYQRVVELERVLSERSFNVSPRFAAAVMKRISRVQTVPRLSRLFTGRPLVMLLCAVTMAVLVCVVAVFVRLR